MLNLKNSARVLFYREENGPDIQFFLFARKIDFAKGPSGHGHDISGEEKFLGIY